MGCVGEGGPHLCVFYSNGENLVSLWLTVRIGKRCIANNCKQHSTNIIYKLRLKTLMSVSGLSRCLKIEH